MKKQIIFLFSFVILTLLEIYIGLFVHDNIIRPYIGDFIVVIVLYCFVRIFVPDKFRLLPLYIFLFAVVIEFGQYFNYVKLLRFENNKLLTILMGTSFSWIDILCYAAGCAILAGIEIVLYERHDKR